MHTLSRGRHTHADRLERWMGKETVERVSREFKDFYWPVPLHGVPGNVFVMPGGDFAGEITVGQFACKNEAAATTLRKLRRRAEQKARRDNALGTLLDMLRAEDRRMASIGAFASIDAVVAAATGGKGQILPFQKSLATTTNAIGNCLDLFGMIGSPNAGGGSNAAPGGTVCSSSTGGALPFKNLGAANSGHYLSWSLTANTANTSLLMYDRLFGVAKTMSSTAAEAVTGTPSRYQNTTPGADDYIGGNFVFPVVRISSLGATAHTWSWVYTDQDNATGNAGTGMTGVSACNPQVLDLAVGNWFMGLATGDLGVRNVTSLTCSASVTGTLDFVIGHPIAVNSCPIANLACLDDGLYTSLNLQAILDNACLTFLELPRPATTAISYTGIVRTVSE